MALLNLKNDLQADKEHFESLYKMTYEEFIDSYSDNIEIDLIDEIVVCIGSDYGYRGTEKPADILAILIPEGERFKYKATLIYSGHIAFIKLEYENGAVKYLYKDDECHPQTYQEFLECEGDVFYTAEENGFKKEDVLKQIEMQIKVSHDFNFKLNAKDVIVLEGL